jgi:hypothetical protein
MFLNNPVGKSVGNKKYYYRRVFSISKFVDKNIFLLQTDLPTEKKLPTKHFRRWFRWYINYWRNICLMPMEKFHQ